MLDPLLNHESCLQNLLRDLIVISSPDPGSIIRNIITSDLARMN